MPIFAEILEKLSFLAGTPAVAGLALTASLIVIAGDWRLSLLALLAQYILAGLLCTRLLPFSLPKSKFTSACSSAPCCIGPPGAWYGCEKGIIRQKAPLYPPGQPRR